MPCYSFDTKLLCFQLSGSRNRTFDFVVGGWQFMSGYFSQSYKNVEYLHFAVVLFFRKCIHPYFHFVLNLSCRISSFKQNLILLINNLVKEPSFLKARFLCR